MAKHLVMQVEVPYIEDGKSEFWQVWGDEDEGMAIVHRDDKAAHIHYCLRDEWKNELTSMMRLRGVQGEEVYSSISNASEAN